MVTLCYGALEIVGLLLLTYSRQGSKRVEKWLRACVSAGNVNADSLSTVAT